MSFSDDQLMRSMMRGMTTEYLSACGNYLDEKLPFPEDETNVLTAISMFEMLCRFIHCEKLQLVLGGNYHFYLLLNANDL